jgi:hypothetical protein
MQKAEAATLFCHLLLVNLEQKQNMISSKAKIESGEGYQLNPKDITSGQTASTTGNHVYSP